MTCMRMRLLFSVSCVHLVLVCVLVRYMGGEGAGGDDVHANATVLAVSCCFTLETSTMQKPRVFKAFQTKTSQLTLKINQNHGRKAWCLRHFRKKLTKQA